MAPNTRTNHSAVTFRGSQVPQNFAEVRAYTVSSWVFSNALYVERAINSWTSSSQDISEDMQSGRHCPYIPDKHGER